MNSLREWQKDALGLTERTEGDLLVAACPGAGKTRYLIAVIKWWRKRNPGEPVFVVVPSDHLRRQMCVDAAKLGVTLRIAEPKMLGALIPDGADGVVTTYAGLFHNPDRFRVACSRRSLVIFDEAHHCGDNKGWGDAAFKAFEMAARRILLTGTPWRRDGSAIPFCDYDQATGDLKVSFSYSFGDAWSESDPPIRDIRFHKYDAEAHWRYSGESQTQSMLVSECVDPDDHGAVLDNLYDTNGSWSEAIFKAAHQDLLERRHSRPDAAGLILAHDIAAAGRWADLVRRVTAQDAVVVTSEGDTSSDKISKFRNGRAQWIIAVRQVSEGVDIPRLEVLVFAAKTITELFFQQAIGRIIRRRDGQPCIAVAYIPQLPALVEMAERIEEMLHYALESREPDEGDGDGGDRTPSSRENLGNDGAFLSGVYSPGVGDMDAEMVERAIAALPMEVREHWQVLLKSGWIPPALPDPEPDLFSEAVAGPDELKMLRARRHRLVGRAAAKSGQSHGDISTDLIRHFRKRVNEMSAADLQASIDYLIKRYDI